MTARRFTPDVIVGGAPRSGTTFIARALMNHPSVHLAQPIVPEPKVFIVPVDDEAEYTERYRALFAETDPAKLRVEKTANYLESTTAPALIKRFVPEAKLVFMLREPVARAYSNYLWTRQNGLEDLPFAEAVELEGNRPNPLGEAKAYARPHDYLCRGNYAPMLARYIEHFGRDRVGVFLYEQIERDPAGLLDAVQGFMGIEPEAFDRLDPGVVNAAREVDEPLDPALAAELRRRVRPWVEAVDEMCDISAASAWGY